MKQHISWAMIALLALLLAFIVSTLTCAAHDYYTTKPLSKRVYEYQLPVDVRTLLTEPETLYAVRILRKRLDDSTAWAYAGHIQAAAHEYGTHGYEPTLAAQVMVESRGIATAVGPRTRWGTALGLGQIMRSIWRGSCPGNLFDPEYNLKCQSHVFAFYLFERCNGSVRCALNGYWGWRGDREERTSYTKDVNTWLE
jgi:hypothetical protein